MTGAGGRLTRGQSPSQATRQSAAEGLRGQPPRRGSPQLLRSPVAIEKGAERWATGPKARRLRQASLALWPCLPPLPSGLRPSSRPLLPGSRELPPSWSPCPAGTALPLRLAQVPAEGTFSATAQKERIRGWTQALRHRSQARLLPPPPPPWPAAASPEALRRLSLMVCGAPAPGPRRGACQHCSLIHLELLSGADP